MPSFQCMVLARSSRAGRRKCRAGSCRTRSCHDLLEFFGRVDQGLGRNAADVEAGAAGLFRLDDDGVDAKLARPDRADIAARAGADHQELAGHVLHGVNPSIKISAGVSSSALMRCTKTAASQPSITR